MTQPRAWYEAYVETLNHISVSRVWSVRLSSNAAQARFENLNSIHQAWERRAKEEHEESSQHYDASAGVAEAYAFVCNLLLAYRDEGKDEDVWSAGLTRQQLQVVDVRIIQETCRCQLLLLGEEP